MPSSAREANRLAMLLASSIADLPTFERRRRLGDPRPPWDVLCGSMARAPPCRSRRGESAGFSGQTFHDAMPMTKEKMLAA
jgi:hypothetical protein